MTKEELDDELHTIVRACRLNNMVTAQMLVERIRDAFYKERIKQARFINAFQNHFISNGDETTFKQIMEAINATH